MGNLPDSARQEIGRLLADGVVGRIWNRDYSAWVKPSSGGEGDWLGWLDLPDDLETLDQDLAAFALEVKAEGFTDVVVLGMGGSSMTPEVLRTVIGPAGGWLETHVLDTVDPRTVTRTAREIDLSRSLFVVASKSGTTVEPLSLEKCFRDLVARTPNTRQVDHFIAISDEGSPLSRRAAAGEFRKFFATPANVGGRYSALTAFGMLPAALMGHDLQAIADAAKSMADACRVDDDTNPGLALGAFLGANATAGRDKVTIVASPGIARFGLWLEQLLAESTGKNGLGLVPIAGEPAYEPDSYGYDRQFVYLRDPQSPDSAQDALADALEARRFSLYRIDVSPGAQLGGEFFRWEFATAVAAIALGVYPFDQPDVESAKAKARAILHQEGTVDAVSAVSLDEALGSLLDGIRAPGYVAIAAYLPESAELSLAIQRLRQAITLRHGVATTSGYGPRYLHSTGQLHKGGPDDVALLGLISRAEADVDVPGENYTLGRLMKAQAAGDVDALRERGRKAVLATVDASGESQIGSAILRLS